MAISYSRKFEHRPWIDNFHRVQAGGELGLNRPFFAIMGDLDEIAEAIGQIDTALSTLGQVVRAPITVGLAPVLLPRRQAAPPWSSPIFSLEAAGTNQGTFAEKPNAQDSADGVLPLDFPNGVKLKSIKVLGDQTGGQMTTTLVRELRTPPFDLANLAVVPGFQTAASAATPIDGSPPFTGDTHLYYLRARITAAAGTDARLRGFQITYEP